MNKKLNVLKEFLDGSQSGGILLIGCTLISLILANTTNWYPELWETNINLSLNEIKIPGDILFWINDFVMAIFFLLVGLEIKRELVIGELSTFKKGVLPFIVALFGMVFPALLYILSNLGKDTISGWAIPSATDIAFALGVLSLLGERVPSSLKVFLTALAVIDDLGAIIIIGLFYGHGFQLQFCLYALFTLIFIYGLNKLKVRKLWVYLVLGIPLWYFMYRSGIHATISGVLLAFVIPLDKDSKKSISINLEHMLLKPVNFIIMPIFALANTSIVINSNAFSALVEPHCFGIGLGLILGKPIGVLSATYLSIKSRLVSLPQGVTWNQIIGVGFLAGIGFTMSIFITMLAFKNEEIISQSKLAIIISSCSAGFIGYLILKNSKGKVKTKSA
ncbi:MAG: Na+/H+ antiporter NhaA [Chlorobiota bacterium]|nr:Na+/H+ antiporter NhaA [Chlorobiota bacterium]QQS67024.1 MAG: Na+/H+ antiporter NhaA [Chlorobiota bacterium]